VFARFNHVIETGKRPNCTVYAFARFILLRLSYNYLLFMPEFHILLQSSIVSTLPRVVVGGRLTLQGGSRLGRCRGVLDVAGSRRCRRVLVVAEGCRCRGGSRCCRGLSLQGFTTLQGCSRCCRGLSMQGGSRCRGVLDVARVRRCRGLSMQRGSRRCRGVLNVAGSRRCRGSPLGETGKTIYSCVTAYARFNHVIPAGFSALQSPAEMKPAHLKSCL
jgi:hypothetical protein